MAGLRADMEALEAVVNGYTNVDESVVVTACKWYHEHIGYTWIDGSCYNIINMEDTGCDNYLEYQAKLTEAERYATSIELLFHIMTTTIYDMQTVLQADVVGVLHQAITNYLAMNITKSELAGIVQSYVIRNALTSVVSDGHDFVSSTVASIQQANLQLVALEEAYTQLYAFTLPVMAEDMLQNMSYIRYLQEANNNDTNALLTTLNDDPLNTTLAVLRHMYTGVFTHELDNVRSELDYRLNDLAEAASDLEDNLESYELDGRMNYKFYTENFLQVDIFYKDLSFERVEQQPSFPFLSLLSEVGGFMGLLLGASILTMCELLDYIVLTVSNKCKKKKEKEGDKETSTPSGGETAC